MAQAWRREPRQALLARLLRGVGERGLTDDVSRRLGELCGDTASNDVVDAHVALLARDGALLRATGSTADIRRC